MATALNLPNVAGGINLPLAGQAGVAQAQPILTNIHVGQAAPTTSQRSLTPDAIQRHGAAAAKAGPYVYWQVARPGRTLKLSGAVNYVNKNYLTYPPGTANAGQPRNTAADRFVYWPNYRVAGTVSEIANAFRQAGVQTVDVSNPLNPAGGSRSVPISEAAIYESSLDPLRPEHRAVIENLASGAAGAPKKGARHSLEEYIEIGNALRAASKGSTTAASGSAGRAATGAASGRGGRSPQANRERLLATFTQMMQQVLSGVEVPKVLNVTRFDPVKVTNARQDATPKSSRSTAIRPVINLGGRAVALPVIAQPSAAPQFQAFFQTVVGQSPQLASIVGPAIQAFNTQLQQKAAPASVVPQLQTQFTQVQQPQVSFQQPQVQFQQPQVSFQVPQVQGALPLPQVGQVLPAATVAPANIMSQLSGPGSPRAASPRVASPRTSPRSGAGSPAASTVNVGGLQLPQIGGLQAAQPKGPTLQLPQVGGIQLPQAGGLQLPTVQGAGFAGVPNLQGASAFPQVSLPTSLTGSPSGQ